MDLDSRVVSPLLARRSDHWVNTSTDRNTRTRDAAGGQWETVLEAGKKPVIYLYPPTAMDVSVRLGLIPAWEFSAVYPLTVIKKLEPIKGQVGQHIEWNVYANPSGLLRDNLSGKEITYLFWEAEYAECLALHSSILTARLERVPILLSSSPHLLTPGSTPRPLTLALPSVLHSTPRHLKSLQMRASSFQPIKYRPILMVLLPCSVYTLKPGRPSLRMLSSLVLYASLSL